MPFLKEQELETKLVRAKELELLLNLDSQNDQKKDMGVEKEQRIRNILSDKMNLGDAAGNVNSLAFFILSLVSAVLPAFVLNPIARKIGIIKPIYGQWNKAKIRGKAGNGVWF